MTIQSLNLQNFRSYRKKTFEFSAETTLLIGPNATGKTNILEAIMFLVTGKSFRADSDREAIAWGETISNIKAQISNMEDGTELELYITQGDVHGERVPVKKYLVNGVPRRQVDFVGRMRAVLFWPEHLELVTDSPSLRRKYLDSVLVQVDREYRRNLLSYERGLRQRNRLLDLINEGKANRSQLLFWNQLLIKAGGYLTDMRGDLLNFYTNYNDYNRYNNYRITYDKSVISESRLAQYADEEAAAGATLVGPHRDDFIIEKYNDYNSYKNYNDYKELSKYGSRGEQRLAVLWMKLAELSYIEQETGERPVLLLDDIFSELDGAHRELVVGLVGKQQTIVTSADEASVPKELVEKGTVIRI